MDLESPMLLLLAVLVALPVLVVITLAVQCALVFRGIARSNAGRGRGIISRNARFGEDFDTGDNPLSLAFMGDSLAAGLGADSAAGTPGFLVAEALAARTRRTVVLTNVAVAGSGAANLEKQLARLLDRTTPDVVVIATGANDTPFVHAHRRAAARLAATIGALRLLEARIVCCTVPQLSSAPALPRTLRWVLERSGRSLRRRQEMVVAEHGGRRVPLHETAGPRLAADPGLLSHDRFHPSSDGYRMACEAIIDAVVAEVSLGRDQTMPTAP
jgi:lysophospholipase L1-like esterase